MVDGDDGLSVHDSAADEGFLAVFAVDGHSHIVGTGEAVGDDHVAAGLKRAEAVGVGGVKVIQRIAAGADVEGVGVGEERLGAHFPERIHNHLGVVGAQEGQVAGLAEVDLDGGELAVEVHVHHAGALDEAAQLLEQGHIGGGAEIGEINLGCSHQCVPPKQY